MNTFVAGVGDCRVTNDRHSVLVTYALGSRAAVMIHNPEAQVGGLLHVMPPEASFGTGRVFLRGAGPQQEDSLAPALQARNI